MVATTAYGYDLELALGIGRQADAGVWDTGVWDTNVWAQPDTVLGDWVDVTCDVVDPFTLAAGTSEADGIATRWEAATCAFTLHGGQWDPWNGPYADILGPELPVRWRWRVSPAPPVPNVGPVASFTHTEADLTTTVVSTSTDPDGTITGWGWSFGDGATATGPTASHTYTSAGTRTVTLTVTDDDGATAVVSHPVTVTAPPPPQPVTAGAVVWFRGKDLGAVGSAVTRWPDQSGLGYDGITVSGAVTVATGTPNGGKVADLAGALVQLDRTRGGLTPTPQVPISSGPGELWGVLKGDNPGAFWRLGAAGDGSHYTSGGQIYDDFGSTTRDNFVPPVSVGTQYRIVHVSVAADGTKSYEVDNLVGAPTFPKTVTIGWRVSHPWYLSAGWTGQWAEFMIRDRVSTPAERAQMLAYLNAEHGLTVAATSDDAPDAAAADEPAADDPDGWEPLFLGRTIDAGWGWDPRTASAEVTASDATADLATFVGIKQAPAGAGETAAARVTRWLDYARWPTDRRDVTAGGVPLVATDMAGKAWEKLLDVADTDVAVMFVDRAGRLVYRPNGRTQVTSVAVVLVACPDPAYPDAVQVVDMGRAEPVPVLNIVSVRGGTPPDGDDPPYVTVTDEGSVSRYRAHRAGYDLEHDTTITPDWSGTVAQLVTTSRAWPSAAPHTLTLGLVSGDARVPAVLFGLDPAQAFTVVDPGGRAWTTQVAGWDVQVGWDTCGGQLFVTDVTTWAGAWWDTALWDHARWTL